MPCLSSKLFSSLDSSAIYSLLFNFYQKFRRFYFNHQINLQHSLKQDISKASILLISSHQKTKFLIQQLFLPYGIILSRKRNSLALMFCSGRKIREVLCSLIFICTLLYLLFFHCINERAVATLVARLIAICPLKIIFLSIL